MMKRRICSVTGIGMLVLMFLAGCAGSKERKVSETEIPTPVLRAFKQAHPSADVHEYAEEVEQGKKLYEISFTENGKKMDVLWTADGNVVELEESISTAQLPDGIVETLSKKYGDYKMEETERLSKGDSVFYEVKIESRISGEEKDYELLFSEDGRLIREAEESDED